MTDDPHLRAGPPTVHVVSDAATRVMKAAAERYVGTIFAMMNREYGDAPTHVRQQACMSMVVKMASGDALLRLIQPGNDDAAATYEATINAVAGAATGLASGLAFHVMGSLSAEMMEVLDHSLKASIQAYGLREKPTKGVSQ